MNTVTNIHFARQEQLDQPEPVLTVFTPTFEKGRLFNFSNLRSSPRGFSFSPLKSAGCCSISRSNMVESLGRVAPDAGEVLGLIADDFNSSKVKSLPPRPNFTCGSENKKPTAGGRIPHMAPRRESSEVQRSFIFPVPVLANLSPIWTHARTEKRERAHTFQIGRTLAAGDSIS